MTTPVSRSATGQGPVLLLLLALLCGCNVAEPQQPLYSSVVAGAHKKPLQHPALARQEGVVLAATRFSLDVAKDVLRGAEGNAVVSPIGLAHVLSLLQQASNPHSESEMQLEYVLHLDRASSLKGIPRLLQNAVTKRRAKSVLESGNSLFVNAESQVKEPFLQLARSQYRMDVSEVDFKQPDAAVAKINKWANDATHGHIPALLSKGSLTPRTSLVLASAMYFRGVWQYQFDVGRTVPKPFAVSPVRNETVYMMQQPGDFRFGELDLDAQWIELPFDGEHFSMLVVLPGQLQGLDDVLQRLEPRHVMAMLGQSPPRRAMLLIPRFQISTDASLTQTLKNLGMPALFGRNAKLGGISDNVLSVSDVIHKAQMKVDEQGATATAASAVLVNTLSLINFSDDMKFYVDRPFLVLIVDRSTMVPLFIGRVANPDREL